MLQKTEERNRWRWLGLFMQWFSWASQFLGVLKFVNKIFLNTVYSLAIYDAFGMIHLKNHQKWPHLPLAFKTFHSRSSYNPNRYLKSGFLDTHNHHNIYWIVVLDYWTSNWIRKLESKSWHISCLKTSLNCKVMIWWGFFRLWAPMCAGMTSLGWNDF